MVTKGSQDNRFRGPGSGGGERGGGRGGGVRNWEGDTHTNTRQTLNILDIV